MAFYRGLKWERKLFKPFFPIHPQDDLAGLSEESVQIFGKQNQARKQGTELWLLLRGAKDSISCIRWAGHKHVHLKSLPTMVQVLSSGCWNGAPGLLGRPVTPDWGSWRQRLEPPAQAHGFCVSLLPVCRNLNTFSGIFKGKSKTSYDFRLIKDNNF